MQNKNEQKLRALIIKWTNHFKWRKDFLKWREGRIWQEKHQEKVINFLEKFTPDLKRKRILDLGSGMGGFLVAMQKKGYDIQGLDPNPDYCEITKLRGKRYDLDIKVVNSFGERMLFPDKSFDFIYCNDVLEHCQNPPRVLEESHRVLKHGGQMYLTVINRFGFKDPHYHLRFINWIPRPLAEKYIIYREKSKENSLFEDRQKLSEMHYFTFNQFKRMADKIGFRAQDLKEYKLSHPELINTPKFLKIAKLLLRLFGASPLIYSLVRLFYLSSFSFMLRKLSSTRELKLDIGCGKNKKFVELRKTTTKE